MSNCPTLVFTAACCLTAFGATAASAGQLSDDAAAPLSRRPYATLFAAARPLPSMTQEAAKAAPPPEPRHTGFNALVRSTASDFVAFPKRKSTWLILGIGGAAALAVHPLDDEINEAAVDADGLRTFFKPGKYLGYAWVQGGAAIGLYLIGRYAMEPDIPGTHTNKVSHLGFDLLRANLLTQAFTYGIKYRGTAGSSNRRDAAPSPRGTPPSRSPRRRYSSATSVIVPAGRCSSSPATCRPAASPTTATS